jgi:conjugative transposon TraK protein
MMFQKMKNIDAAFRQVRLFSAICIAAITIVAVFASYKAFELVSQSRQKVFVLANGKALEAFAAERKDNVPVEARDHVKMFHYHFFTLDPDDKVIESNITKALYLADASAKQQYDNLKENGYFSNIIAGNISQEITMDSIVVSTDSYPYYFWWKGEQKITRPTTIVTRSLITEGYLRNTSRSDNNPHGFLIEKWRTLENRDINTQTR